MIRQRLKNWLIVKLGGIPKHGYCITKNPPPIMTIISLSVKPKHKAKK